jgi:hypothetical protein
MALAVGALLLSLLDRPSHDGLHSEAQAAGDRADADWGRVVTEGVSMLLRGIVKEH